MIQQILPDVGFVFQRTYKISMRPATIDSIATTQMLRDNLHNLSVFARKVSGDIDKINIKFDTNYSQILAWGAKVYNTIGILFNAYSIGTCYNFKMFIKQKHNDYLDGFLTITHEACMASGKAKMDYLRHKGT